MRQFYLAGLKDQDAAKGQRVTLDPDESHHLFTVLRGGRDEILQLTDGQGRRFTGRTAGGGRKAAVIELLSVTDDLQEQNQPRLTLACAVVKGRRFEWVLEKAVEIGAHRIVPLITGHGVITPGDGKQKRWQGILVAALKQSGRSWLPELSEAQTTLGFLQKPTCGPILFGSVPDEIPQCRPWTDLLEPVPDSPPDNLSLMVGPEGGWTEPEIELFQRQNLHPVSLGPHVLRTETAALAGLTALQSLRQAWNRGVSS